MYKLLRHERFVRSATVKQTVYVSFHSLFTLLNPKLLNFHVSLFKYEL